MSDFKEDTGNTNKPRTAKRVVYTWQEDKKEVYTLAKLNVLLSNAEKAIEASIKRKEDIEEKIKKVKEILDA